jgi:hypothetical protein
MTAPQLESKSMIGWLSKFIKPRIWQAMILAIIWLATKTCQPSHIWLAKFMAIFFYLALACQNLGMTNFGWKPIRSEASIVTSRVTITPQMHPSYAG